MDRSKPPGIQDSAKVIAFAVLDESVIYTGKVSMYVDGNLIGPVPKLSICQNPDEDDYLLFYCDECWEVLAAAGGDSIEQVKEMAEKAYAGISSKWQWFT